MTFIMYFITFGLLVTIALADGCPYKECFCTETSIVCDSGSLTAIPHKLFNSSSSVRSLNLDGNQITTIPAGSLPGNLSSISLEHDPIETIDENAFDDSVYTLEKLTFVGARFTQIPEAVFHLKALKSLDIYEANILVWNEDGMKKLGSTMEILSLTNVGLTAWPIWMKSMTNLTELTIAGGYIYNIPDDALDMVSDSLTYLVLTSVGLTKLPKSMSKMTALSTLTLDYNNIVDVTWLPQKSSLKTLYLYGNKISDAQKLSNALRSSANTLSNIDIQNNSLTSIPELSFLTQMSDLTFAVNHISDPNSGSLPSNLTQLQLNNNLFSSIPSVMGNLKMLTELILSTNNIHIVQGSHIPSSVDTLDLSFNSVSQLSRSSFPQNSSLSYLTLSNNPLSIVSSDAFYNLPVLAQLNLQSTKLTRLPLAVVSLTKLYYFDISNSINLVCTCQEQSLRPWIISIGHNGIVGNCGMTSVFIFFEMLSPQCPQLT